MADASTTFRKLLTNHCVSNWSSTPLIPAPLPFDPRKQSQGGAGDPGIDEYSTTPGTWAPDDIRQTVGYVQLVFTELSVGGDELAGLSSGVESRLERVTYMLEFNLVLPATFDDGDVEAYVEKIKAPVTSSGLGLYGMRASFSGPPALNISHHPIQHQIRWQRGDIAPDGAWRTGDVVRVPIEYDYLRPLQGATTLTLP